MELLTRLERVKEKLVPPICVYEEEDAALAEVVIDALPSIIRDLRRLVDLEMEAKADDAHIAALEKEVEQLRGEPGAGEERLVEVEAENARLNEMAMNYQRLCDERYAKLGRDHDAAQRRLVEVEAELERTRVKLHCYVAAADAEATFANESELQRLRAALKPFADRAESLRQLASDLDSTEARVCGTQPVPVQHLIAAAEALAHREGQ